MRSRFRSSLYALAIELEPEEPVAVLVPAGPGSQLGTLAVLAATDRRLLCITRDGAIAASVPFARITSLSIDHPESHSWIDPHDPYLTTLGVETPDGTLAFQVLNDPLKRTSRRAARALYEHARRHGAAPGTPVTAPREWGLRELFAVVLATIVVAGVTVLIARDGGERGNGGEREIPRSLEERIDGSVEEYMSCLSEYDYRFRACRSLLGGSGDR